MINVPIDQHNFQVETGLLQQSTIRLNKGHYFSRLRSKYTKFGNKSIAKNLAHKVYTAWKS